jgi:hypothetical protein
MWNLETKRKPQKDYNQQNLNFQQEFKTTE